MTTPLVLLSLFQRNQELHDKVLRLEVENTSRLHFLAQMSHELRAPLNTILGNTQLLRRDALPRQQEFLQAIELSGRHFLRMIEDLLDHARGAIGRLHLAPEPLDWPSFLRELGQIGRSLAQQQANAFVLETRGPHPAAVVADGQRLRQVLENLLVNAARHTRNGLIRVECTATAAESGLCRLEFAVVDSGEGIAPADLERVFLPFERGRDAHRSGKGAGMGLTIARQLTEAMGGTVQALSSPGAGSTFRVSLQVPLAAGVLPEAAPPLADLPTAYVGAQRHLLLAEDEPEAVAVLSTLLTSLGFVVRCVGCGNAAVQALDQEHFDLVLVDQHMPEGDGWLVLEQCRRRHAGLAVFLLSSSPPIRPPHCAPGLVFDAHFLKPLDHRALLDRIGNVLDLQWVTAPIPVVEAKPSHPDTRPDAATLARLRALLDLGQVSEIMALALELKGQPMLCDYANRLYQASTNLDFVELARLCSAPDA